MLNPAHGASRLKRALQKSEKLTSIPIEVLMLSGTSQKALAARMSQLAQSGVLQPGQAIIGIDPVNRHVALGLTPELDGLLDRVEILSWLQGFQEDLHMTAFENAVGLAVLSLAMAFSESFPANRVDDLS